MGLHYLNYTMEQRVPQLSRLCKAAGYDIIEEMRPCRGGVQGGRAMVTNNAIEAWLQEQGHPVKPLKDPRTGTPVYVVRHPSAAARMEYTGMVAVPPGRFMMIKVVGCSLEKYHPRACEAVLMQFNGLMNRRPSKDSYNYSVDHNHLAIVFWPENTTVGEMQRVMEYGFDRLEFMYRNLERLDLEG